MGTRGAYGFRIDGTDKITYNHFDSYPVGLGKDVMVFVKNTSIDEMLNIARKIILVNEEVKPTEEQKEELKKYADIKVSSQSLDEWYVLLRNTQGNLNFYKEGLIYMIDSCEFLADSLFCEWAYIINLDTRKLEIYRGFNKSPNGKGRYAQTTEDCKYYGVTLLGETLLENIQKISEDRIQRICEIIESTDNDDDAEWIAEWIVENSIPEILKLEESK